MMESNGPENYGRWHEMLAEHPRAGASWLAAHAGAYELDDSYFNCAGGILDDPQAYFAAMRRRG
jgi:hypothetical protein